MNDFFFGDAFEEILISLAVQNLYCIDRGHFSWYRFLRGDACIPSKHGATNLMYRFIELWVEFALTGCR